jgi:isocitrate/isopropylmalate dehydrogenase/regulator of RNase E activity RraA
VKSDAAIKIAVLPGDGIGQEVIDAALPIFEALKMPVELNRSDIGWACWQRAGRPIPDHAWELIRRCDTTLLGAITSKPPREAHQELIPALQKKKLEYVSPLIQLRQQLDLFANVRPCFNIIDEKKTFNYCIIRENTEGLYAGFDFYPLPASLLSLLKQHPHWQSIPSQELSCTLRLQSKQGLERLFKYSFEYAHKNGFTRVTFADKPNVLRKSGAFARDIFESIAMIYPHIKADILNVDAVALWLIKRPEEFGVVVAENMFGDLLSDVGAAVMGGLGFAPSANIGHKGCYFEPVHGSGPRIKKNSANPSAMFLTISMLMRHFGYSELATVTRQAVVSVVQEGRFITYDLGGNSSTVDMAQAIIEKAQQLGVHSNQGAIDAYQFQAPAGKPRDLDIVDGCEQLCLKTKIEQLKQFSSAEISDALDAFNVEGALLNLKPLTFGQKLIGPAYTIQFSPYTTISTTFKSAANYIDDVPAESVIVVDNQARMDCTVWGNILTEVALLKHISGTIVNGAVRDANLIRETSYPLYCLGHYMRSGKNRVYKKGEQCPVIIGGVVIHPGDLIFADDDGVVVIPIRLIDEVICKAANVQKTEQKIIAAVKAGTRLEQARRDYRYDKPWLGK